MNTKFPTCIAALALAALIPGCSKPETAPSDKGAQQGAGTAPAKAESQGAAQKTDNAAAIEQRETEQQARIASLEKERQAKIEEMSHILLVALLEKQVRTGEGEAADAKAQVTVRFGLFNKGDKDIKAFRGKAIFSDMDGAKLRIIKMAVNEPIGAGKQTFWVGGVGINQLRALDQKFSLAEKSSLQFMFVPEMIQFSDGSRLEAPAD